MKSQIIARVEFAATHRWPDAPPHRAYLASSHFHVFKFEARASVSHLDRQIEFHDLRTRLHEVVAKIANYRIDGPATFSEMSCEMIGEKILEMMPELSSVVVSEDGLFDAEVTRTEIRPPIITICGSTKFKTEYEEAEDKLEKDGWAVMSVGSFPNYDGIIVDDDLKARLDDLHLRKIAMSDAVYVVNPNGYIGDSTRSEIEYARSLGKAVLSLESLNF